MKEAWTFLHFVLSCVSPRTDSVACGWEQRHCGWPHSILGRAEPPEATHRWECHLGTRNSFFWGLFTGFWNHGKWKCEMRQAHVVYSNTWWLNNVGRQQMGSECYVFPADSSLSAKVYISKNLYWFSQFSLVLLVNFHKYVFGVQIHSKNCILWLCWYKDSYLHIIYQSIFFFFGLKFLSSSSLEWKWKHFCGS